MSNIYKFLYIWFLILYVTELGDRGTLHPDGTGIDTIKN
jgi:hypothetical protein